MTNAVRRRQELDARRQNLPTTSEVLPAPVPSEIDLTATVVDPLATFSAYDDLVTKGKIGINSDQVSSGETPIIYSILLMGG